MAARQRESAKQPANLVRELVQADPDYAEALRGNAAALIRLVEGAREAAVERGPIGGSRAKHDRSGANAHERKHAAVSAKQLAKAVAAEPTVAFWREMIAPVATVRWLRMGKDALGQWRDVKVGIPAASVSRGFSPFPISTLRLRDEPLALEVRDDSPYARVEPGSTLESLLRQARALAALGGWSEAEAFRFLVGGKAPKPAPLVVRVTTPRGKPEAATVTIMAGAHVSSASVAAAFAKAARHKRGRPESTRTLAVVAFVDRQTAAHDGQRPPWPKLMAKWNRANPRWRCSYPDLRKTYMRALDRKQA